MKQSQTSEFEFLSSFATAFLWVAAPAGIALGMISKAFEVIYPAWYLPWGGVLQIGLLLALVVYVEKIAPHEAPGARIGSLFMFLIPLPLAIFSGAMAGLAAPEHLATIRQYSPYVAWGIPIFMMGFMSLPFVRRKG